jgi:hypothetical protein
LLFSITFGNIPSAVFGEGSKRPMRTAGMQKLYFQAVIIILDDADFGPPTTHLIKPLCHLASAT